ncbi:hypothetical protein F9222_23295 [Escherichia coli]|nr:hypothetical protein F9222_23295 [Escherichia coli]
MNLPGKIKALKKVNNLRIERTGSEIAKKNEELNILKIKKDDMSHKLSNLHVLFEKKNISGKVDAYSIMDFLRKKSIIQQQINDMELQISLMEEQFKKKADEITELKKKQKMMLIKSKKLEFHHEKYLSDRVKSEIQSEANICEELIYAHLR